MSVTIEHEKKLSPLTTFKVGGYAEYFVDVHTNDEVIQAVAYAKEHGLGIKILGAGSNVLVSDGVVSGLVIHICTKGVTQTVEGEYVLMTACAGETLDDIVAYTVEHNWWGLENLSHIPGSVGATPVQNVGAYGVEVRDCIESVTVFNIEKNTFETLNNEECQFGYRDSLFKKAEGKKYIVMEVTYRLSLTPNPKLEYRDLQNYFHDATPSLTEIRDAVIEIRSKKFPDWNEVGNAGSFFKNPVITAERFKALQEKYQDLPGYVTDTGSVKIPLGWILDKVLALRGLQEGNVGTYKEQALVLINCGNATAQEIQSFANSIIAKIKNTMGIVVEWEVTKFE